MGTQSRISIDAMVERVRDVVVRWVGKCKTSMVFWPMVLSLARCVGPAVQICDVSGRLRMLFDLESSKCGDAV
jgi:hypothetical protein